MYKQVIPPIVHILRSIGINYGDPFSWTKIVIFRSCPFYLIKLNKRQTILQQGTCIQSKSPFIWAGCIKKEDCSLARRLLYRYYGYAQSSFCRLVLVCISSFFFTSLGFLVYFFYISMKFLPFAVKKEKKGASPCL